MARRRRGRAPRRPRPEPARRIAREASIADALRYPARLAMLELLRKKGALQPSRIAAEIGCSPQVAVQHLAKLRAHQLVAHERKGQATFYRLRHPAPTANLLRCLKTLARRVRHY